jgi:ABC-type transporter Mla maintaining outer membrane lipid asymmetry ATPase subunit MlaF
MWAKNFAGGTSRVVRRITRDWTHDDGTTVVLLDEPGAGVDPYFDAKVAEMIEQLKNAATRSPFIET